MSREGVRIYVSGNYTDIHDNQVVNVYTDKEDLKSAGNKEADENTPTERTAEKKDILEYVMRLHPLHVHPKWTDRYADLWKEVLELPEVSDAIYQPGKQRGTNFNRSLTANILHLMREMNVLTGNNQSMAEILEGNKNASVRGSLGEMPANRSLTKGIRAILVKVQEG